MTGRGPFMKLCQGPRLHKADSVCVCVWGAGGGTHWVGRLLLTINCDQFWPKQRAHQHLCMMIRVRVHLMTPLGRTRQHMHPPENMTVNGSYHTSCLVLMTSFSTRLVKTPPLHQSSHQHRPCRQHYLCNDEEVIAGFSLNHYLLAILKLNRLQSIGHRQTFPFIQRLCKWKMSTDQKEQCVIYTDKCNSSGQTWLCVFHRLRGCLLLESGKIVRIITYQRLIRLIPIFIRDHNLSGPTASSLRSKTPW